MTNGKWLTANVTALVLLTFLIAATGCTRESVRMAIESQRRANQVQQTVFERQHEGLRILLYRDLITQLESSGVTMTSENRAVVSAAWNERDLVEFWAIQNERAKALRLAGVDAKLYNDQSVLDLLLKSLSAKTKRLEQGIASWAGAQAAEKAKPDNE